MCMYMHRCVWTMHYLPYASLAVNVVTQAMHSQNSKHLLPGFFPPSYYWLASTVTVCALPGQQPHQ